MEKIDTESLKEVLSAAVGLEGPTMWRAIDDATDRVAQDPARRDAALQAGAYAHLACFSSDGRHLTSAVRSFYRLGDHDTLRDLLDMAKTFGDTWTAIEIRHIGEITHDRHLTFPKFAEWFRDFGVRWFDVYEDPEHGVSFIEPMSVDLFRALAAQEYPDPTKFWNSVVSQAEADKNYSPLRLALLKCLASERETIIPTPPNRRQDVDRQFREYAERHGIRILRQLASGQEGLRRCSNVYLTLRSTETISIFKEILTHEEDRIGAKLNEEPDILVTLGGDIDFPTRLDDIRLDDGTRFLRRTYEYGQALDDYLRPGNALGKRDTCEIIGCLAQALATLHAKGVLYLDLRPDNVLVDAGGAKLFDFNASRRSAPGVMSWREVTAYILDPKFAPPEVTLRCKASSASDIFQLGLLFHQLLYGKLPFVTLDTLKHGDNHREQAVLKFSLANALLPYEYRPEKDFSDPRLVIIRRMLSKQQEERPTAEEVAELFWTPRREIKLRNRAANNAKEANTVLFPARMGIPHRGHIEYISRLLDIGYHVRISLQRSYTITDRDPLPKWIVLKMVARSLLRRGYAPEAFSFQLTPFFETDQQHSLHFKLSKDYADVVAVASSNPSIRQLFPDKPILDRSAVFDVPADPPEWPWGETLRKAVRSGDIATFGRYVAEGVEDILSFDELRECYAKTPIEFVPGKVKITVTDADEQPKTLRLRHYDLPEVIAAQAVGGELLEPFAKESLIRKPDGTTYRLRYLHSSFKKGDETIFFRLKQA